MNFAARLIQHLWLILDLCGVNDSIRKTQVTAGPTAIRRTVLKAWAGCLSPRTWRYQAVIPNSATPPLLDVPPLYWLLDSSSMKEPKRNRDHSVEDRLGRSSSSTEQGISETRKMLLIIHLHLDTGPALVWVSWLEAAIFQKLWIWQLSTGFVSKSWQQAYVAASDIVQRLLCLQSS